MRIREPWSFLFPRLAREHTQRQLLLMDSRELVDPVVARSLRQEFGCSDGAGFGG